MKKILFFIALLNATSLSTKSIIENLEYTLKTEDDFNDWARSINSQYNVLSLTKNSSIKALNERLLPLIEKYGGNKKTSDKKIVVIYLNAQHDLKDPASQLFKKVYLTKQNSSQFLKDFTHSINELMLSTKIRLECAGEALDPYETAIVGLFKDAEKNWDSTDFCRIILRKK